MKFIAFIAWIFRQIGYKLQDANESYRNLMEANLMISLLFTALLTTITMIAAALFATSVLGFGNSAIGYVGISVILTGVLYFCYTGISLMYEAFNEERKDLFNKIKNS